MTRPTCKDCSKENDQEHHEIYDRCISCEEKKVKRDRRLVTLVLLPLWLPFWFVGMIAGSVLGFIWRGFKAGRKTIKALFDAW